MPAASSILMRHTLPLASTSSNVTSMGLDPVGVLASEEQV
jgi:hypothetical protein